MGFNRISKTMGLLAALALAAGIAGCRVHVDKGANGEDKNVQVDTPFGGVHVNTDQTTASDLGLPVYPGAVSAKGDDNHKSADVHMGFGEWQLRVRAVSYTTPDPEDKVIAFYRKALARYGDVTVSYTHLGRRSEPACRFHRWPAREIRQRPAGLQIQRPR